MPKKHRKHNPITAEDLAYDPLSTSLIEMGGEEDEDIDVDVYGGGGDEEEDIASHDLSGDEEVTDLDDLDTTDVADGPDAVDGVSLDPDPDLEGEGEPGMEDVVSLLSDLVDTLQAKFGDEPGPSGDEMFGSDPGEDPDFEGELEGEFDGGVSDEPIDVEGSGEETDDAMLGDEEEDEDVLGEEQDPNKYVPQNKPNADQLDKTASKGTSPQKGQGRKGKGITGKEDRQDIRKILSDIEAIMNKGVSPQKGQGRKGKGAGNQGNNGGPGKIGKDAERLFKAESVIAAVRAKVDVDYTADVQNIMNLDESLPPEYQARIKKMYEGAVNRTLDAVLEGVGEYYEAAVATQLEDEKRNIVERADEYLDYIAKLYIEENRMAIDEGIGNGIAESFMHGMRELFENHFISVPEGKADLVKMLQSKTKALQESADSMTAKAIKLRRENKLLRKKAVLSELSGPLTDMEALKLRKLSESVEYKDQEQFKRAVSVIRETHFPKKGRLTETRDFEALAEDVREKGKSEMDPILNALRRTSRNK